MALTEKESERLAEVRKIAAIQLDHAFKILGMNSSLASKPTSRWIEDTLGQIRKTLNALVE